MLFCFMSRQMLIHFFSLMQLKEVTFHRPGWSSLSWYKVIWVTIKTSFSTLPSQGKIVDLKTKQWQGDEQSHCQITIHAIFKSKFTFPDSKIFYSNIVFQVSSILQYIISTAFPKVSFCSPQPNQEVSLWNQYERKYILSLQFRSSS